MPIAWPKRYAIAVGNVFRATLISAKDASSKKFRTIRTTINSRAMKATR